MARNHPFYRVAAQAQEHMLAGHDIHQKFTCGRCRARQIMTVPNRFFTKGICEECGYETDLEEAGCNYLLVATVNRQLH